MRRNAARDIQRHVILTPLDPLNVGSERDPVAISPQELLPIIALVLYLPALLAAFWKLMPRLPSFAQSLAKTLMLAQIVIVLLSLLFQFQGSVTYKLVDLAKERNPASALAGLQLALVAGYFFIIAWLARTRPKRQRLYFLGLAAVYLYLTLDELFVLGEGITRWAIFYTGGALAIAAMTVTVARRSPRPARIWFACFLVGLALSALGAIALENLRYPEACRALGLYYIDNCLLTYVEEPMKYLGNWLALLGTMGLLPALAPPPKRGPRLLLYGLPVLALMAIVNFSDPDLDRVMRRTGAVDTDLRFEANERVHGYQLEIAPDADHIEATLWLSAQPFDYDGLGYSIQLVDLASEKTLASRDENVTVLGGSILGPFYLPIFRQTVHLSLPPEARANRAYWVLLRLWREQHGNFASQKVLRSDRRTLGDTRVLLTELVLPAAPIDSPAVPRARFDNGFVLYAADVPESASPAETLSLEMTWRAEAEDRQDYTQFLHFIHEETSAWWVFDQQPLGARLPTRLWYSGLADSETWVIPLPADLAPGRYQVWTGLYRADDQQRLGAADADGAPYRDALAPLGMIDIKPA